MIRRTPRSTRTDTLVPYTTLFRSTASPAFARCLLSHFRAFAHFPMEIEIMNRRFGVVATLVVSALAFTGGAILYSGSVAGEPAPKAVAGPVDELIRPDREGTRLNSSHYCASSL